MSPIDGYERRSWGLGIVLSNSHGQKSAGNQGGAIPEPLEQKQAGGSLYSLFHRVSTGIATFLTTEVEKPSKTPMEDILESYYLSQGREVPDWVYYPPPDPTAPDTSVVDGVPAYKSMRPSVKESEPESEMKTKYSSSASGGALRSFARLNISRLTRTTQFTLGNHSSSTSNAVESGTANIHDSGFNSPARSPSGPPPNVDVHIVESGNTSPGSLHKSESAEALTQEESSGKTPNLIQRSLTLDRWRRKDQQRMGSPISMASLMGKKSEETSKETSTQSSKPCKLLGLDSPPATLDRPPLTSSVSEPFKPRPLRSKFSVRLGHKNAMEQQAKTKHMIPDRVKRLFKRHSSYEQQESQFH
ncbi:hypothetical protein H4218_001262 [Coemansia sp. IMI 209128]|nr:hypothetical protein GGI06_001046 [Coemansia sp. S85]KAJ2413339.1 hypothetical protein GGI10_003121 [Coemansia sp. RSA 2530]KAJ2701662.1 hypothetical protein H4218_001262 [Coemansia sp. IMI 209128]